MIYDFTSDSYGFNGNTTAFLEKCSTVDEVIKWLHRIPIASAQTFTVADQRGEIAVIECCADSIPYTEAGRGSALCMRSQSFSFSRTGEMEHWRNR